MALATLINRIGRIGRAACCGAFRRTVTGRTRQSHGHFAADADARVAFATSDPSTALAPGQAGLRSAGSRGLARNRYRRVPTGAWMTVLALIGAKAASERDRAEIECLALNIYHEGRNESQRAKLAIAAVTLNRVRSERFPDTICEVVWQPGQFSWTSDGRSDQPREPREWRIALRLAENVYRHRRGSDVGDAVFFHRKDIRPDWADDLRVVRQVGDHVFYTYKAPSAVASKS
jgi:hypothetical protein